MEEINGMTEVTLPDGSIRGMGNNAPPVSYKTTLPEFGSTQSASLIPESDWPKLISAYSEGPEDPHLPYVHNQMDVGQCNASTTTAGLEYLRARQGLPEVRLSSSDLYSRINGQGGGPGGWRDQGSMLEDALRESMTNGVGTVATSGYLFKRGEWKGPATAAERAKYRLLEAFICPTFNHVMSAILQGFVVNTGILWYDNYTPGTDGWLPRPAGRAGGHAILGYKPAMKQGTYGIWHQNSWGNNWPRMGLGGKFVIPRSAYAGPVGGWFAFRSVADEGNVVPILSV